MRRAGELCASAAGWLLVGVPVAAIVVTIPTSLVLLAFGLGLFVFPTIAAGVVLLRRGPGAPVAGLLVAVAMAALLLHATTWAGDLKHAWFFWPLMAYAAVTAALGLAAGVLLLAVGGARVAGRRSVTAAVVLLLVLAVGSLWWVAAGG